MRSARATPSKVAGGTRKASPPVGKSGNVRNEPHDNERWAAR
jgi:hypothetical protein